MEIMGLDVTQSYRFITFHHQLCHHGGGGQEEEEKGEIEKKKFFFNIRERCFC
jgi:hypothetical protein